MATAKAVKKHPRAWEFDADAITAVREGLSLSPSAFGGQLVPRMSGRQIIDIEHRKRGLTVTSLLRLCNYYGLNPAELFKNGR